ncbi:hypothetical protein [Frateuria defendens]|uniref:hypothetical protein n=1 Tax=Frateuria defendens TaxID=2219559 RepID=UPI00066FE1F5|nr:hypothetical protein [Frateuria defendens]
MQRKTLLASTLALLLAGGGALAFAQDNTPPPPAAAPGAPAQTDHGGRWHGQRDHADGHRLRAFGLHGREGGVIADLHALERLYITSGRAKELPALYNEVLAKSHNPRVREYVYHRLARAQAQPANVDQAIATLRKSLNENLANEAKRRAEFEKLRTAWEQRHAQPDAAQPSAK